MLLPLILTAGIAAADPACAAQIASAKPTIEHANDDWVRALRARDAAGIAAAYADDGVFVLADGTEVKGRAAVEKLYAAQRPVQILGGGIESQGIVCGADGLLYEWGQGRLVIRAKDGAERKSGGPYLTVWKRFDSGWRIVRNLAF
jgi:uncharacterized protein (TIGR02246 family)